MGFKILHVAAMPFPSYQGTQVYIGQLCQHLAESGHEIHLLTYHFGLPLKMPEKVTIHRIKDFPVYRSLRSGPSWKKIFLDIGAIPEIKKLIRKIKPDIIHAHHFEALFASILAGKNKVPIVYHAHTLLGVEMPWYFRKKISKEIIAIAGRLADSILPARADACAVISPVIAQNLINNGVTDEKVFYVPPAIDPPHCTRKTTEISNDNHRWNFIYTGNLDGYQGIEYVMERIAEMAHDKFYPTMCIISDSNPNHIVKLAQKLGIERYVEFQPHGEITSIYERLQMATIALVPRLIPGGFPVKLLNYIHAARPVLASIHGAAGMSHESEIMIYDDKDSFIRYAIELTLNKSLRNKIIKGAQSAAREKFSWKTAENVLEKIYTQVSGLY